MSEYDYIAETHVDLGVELNDVVSTERWVVESDWSGYQSDQTWTALPPGERHESLAAAQADVARWHKFFIRAHYKDVNLRIVRETTHREVVQ